MGCSASRTHTFITKEQPSSSLSSSCESQCPYSNSSSTQLSRTLSLPASLVHHPPICKGDTTHLVSLTSSTYGSLSLIHPKDPNFMDQESLKSTTHPSKLANICDSTPLSPHSVINTWELMEGLDEFSFDFVDAPFQCPENELIKSYEIVEYNDSKPLWQHLSVESLLSNMDPNVDSSYRKALRSKRFESCDTKDVVKMGLETRSKKEITETDLDRNNELHERFEGSETKDVVKKGLGYSELDCRSKKETADMESNRMKEFGCKELHERSFGKWNSEFSLSGKEDKIVLYYTSLRGIRKTFQDCCEIRAIFRDYRVFVDERDTSMEPSYRMELQDMLKGKVMSLPQVFVRGEYIGGADQIRQHHESGYLSELLKAFPIVNLAFACERCGDARFVLCLTCNGSRKVFEENKERTRCLKCNENGLIRCPSC